MIELSYSKPSRPSSMVFFLGMWGIDWKISLKLLWEGDIAINLEKGRGGFEWLNSIISVLILSFYINMYIYIIWSFVVKKFLKKYSSFILEHPLY